MVGLGRACSRMGAAAYRRTGRGLRGGSSERSIKVSGISWRVTDHQLFNIFVKSHWTARIGIEGTWSTNRLLRQKYLWSTN